MEKDSEIENNPEIHEKKESTTNEQKEIPESQDHIIKKKKNKKKKEKKQLESDEKKTTETEIEVEDPQKQYEKELQWCIDQIKFGIVTNKLDSLQLKESEKVLQVLESKTAPLVKKRHLMSVVFGDYRKLMKKK